METLIANADAEGLVDWSVSIDSTIARVHQHASNVTRHTGVGSNYKDPGVEPIDHAIGRSRGILSAKPHALVDGTGLPLVIAVSPGQSGDSPMLMTLMERLSAARPVGRPRNRLDAARGDKSYSSRANRRHLRDRGVKAVTPSRPTRSATGNAEDPAADDLEASTPKATRAGTSSNDASASASSGAVSPPDTPSWQSSTAPLSSSKPPWHDSGHRPERLTRTNMHVQVLRVLIVAEVRQDTRLTVTEDDIRGDRLDDLQQPRGEDRVF